MKEFYRGNPRFDTNSKPIFYINNKKITIEQIKESDFKIERNQENVENKNKKGICRYKQKKRGKHLHKG